MLTIIIFTQKKQSKAVGDFSVCCAVTLPLRDLGDVQSDSGLLGMEPVVSSQGLKTYQAPLLSHLSISSGKRCPETHGEIKAGVPGGREHLLASN